MALCELPSRWHSRLGSDAAPPWTGRPPNFRNLDRLCAQMWGLAPAPAARPHPPAPGRRRRRAEAAVAGGAGWGIIGARKSRARTASWALTTRTMARPNLVLAIGLALLAFCLLALPEDTWAAPREHMTGGRQNLSPDDPQVQKAAQAAVAGYNMGNNSPYFFRDTKVIKAESQVRRALGTPVPGEGHTKRESPF